MKKRFRRVTFSNLKSRRILALVLLCVYVLLGVLAVRAGTYAGMLLYPGFNAEREVRHIRAAYRANVFDGIRSNLEDLIMRGGIAGVQRVVHEALSQGDFGVYQCHTLMHALGHEAYKYYEGDVEKVAVHVNDFCDRGYPHGAGAQIYQEGVDQQEKLQHFCEAMRKKIPGTECYHGAGHAIMRHELDVQFALKQCQRIVPQTPTQREDEQECFRGLFSELTNLINNIDGETGRKIPGPPIMVLGQPPIDFCAKLAPEYEISCAFELGADMLTVTRGDFKEALRGCVVDRYSEDLQWHCIRSVTAAHTQQSMANGQDFLTIPDIVFSFKKQLRKAYIEGAAGELGEAERWGPHNEWEKFCHGFTDNDDKQFCQDRVMERSFSRAS